MFLIEFFQFKILTKSINKKIFKGLLLLFLCCPGSLSGQTYPVVNITDALDSTNLVGLYQDKIVYNNIRKSLSMVESYLKNDFFMGNTNLPETNGVSAIIMERVTPKNVLYEIVGIDSFNDSSVIISMNLYYDFSASSIRIFKGLLKIGVDLKNNKVIFPVYNSQYQTTSYSNITFYIKKNDSDTQRLKLLEANDFLLETIQDIRKESAEFNPPSKKLKYIVGDGYFGALEYFSFYNFFSISRFVRTDCLIIDVASGNSYKHEITHYIFSNYQFNRFLDEGMATLFGGGEGPLKNSTSNWWSVMCNKIHIDEKYRNAIDTQELLSSFRYNSEMYAISAMLLFKYYKKVGGKIFYDTLFNKLIKFSDAESVDFLKKELGIQQLSTFVVNTEVSLWEEIVTKSL
ncbi:hypothetical protein J2T02_005579 [Chitinophaga terrae (ex Kim and Jung 2007)]|uniref:hypothetical protein n=1 Tax=Chitinophaga terrae (ex Kim and Jung 2007) TaxID=408074 RepID=UPI00278910D9|nr:hypothetical protein [Chitinophaga terrae (ex Kim and Jung 2007)]MDQ0110429.1 hypothetical protein [Chitinophaga terrae (ex Kim and Jung 2007)]